MLDSGPLGQLAHHKPKQAAVEWLDGLLAAEVKIVIPEFEVRRSLLLHNLQDSITALEELRKATAVFTDHVIRHAQSRRTLGGCA
jgi:hypothetical protein